jgi:hypothetical protein
MRSPARIYLLFIFLELLIGLVAVLVYGFTTQALQATTRFSGRLSLLVFSVIFIFPKIQTKTAFFRNRYSVFALVHGIHLLELLSFISVAHAVLVPYRLAGGFVAYALIFVMPIASKMNAGGALKSNLFSKFELIFHFYVWSIFFMTYLPRVQGKVPNAGGTFLEHAFLLGWVVLLLVVRMATVRKLTPASNA